MESLLDEVQPLGHTARSIISIRLWHHKLFVQQHDWQVIRPCNFHDLLTRKHFEDRVKDTVSSRLCIRACNLKIIPGLVRLSFQEISALVLICNIYDIGRLHGSHLFLFNCCHCLPPG